MSFEEIIRRAKEEGRFSELPGKGKPLNLAEKGPKDLVSGLIKDSGYVPEWAAIGKDLAATEEQAKSLEERFRQRRNGWIRAAEAHLRKNSLVDALDTMKQCNAERASMAMTLSVMWVKLRKGWEHYNLLVPNGRFALPKPEQNIEAFLEEFPEIGLSQDGSSIIHRPEGTDARALLKAAQSKVEEEEKSFKTGMNSARAEALIGYKNTHRRR